MYLLGYDIGSSSIKAGLIESATGKQVAVVSYPDSEMEIIARESGWAEQNPEVWWQNLVEATKKLLTATAVNRDKIEAIGISYQMHGLVLVDQNQEVLRPAIIWCDSRAVKIGDQAFDSIGEQTCLNTLLNSPGNFTASKLKWVKDHEPEVYARIHKAMLPGDYIAMKLTGKIATTISGLSEGIFWDFQQKEISQELMEEFGFDMSLLPDLVETIGNQGELNSIAADRLSLPLGTPVAYRGGDQPNNAMTLNVLMPGEVAATCGTSGVVYGVIDKPIYDQLSRVNSFAHVNYNLKNDRIGVLLCINGAGILYSWMKKQLAEAGQNFKDLEKMASEVPIGSEGVTILPFGNGAERVFENKNLGAHILGLEFNRHSRSHLYRASLEGIAFSFVYGLNLFKQMEIPINVLRVGNDNMFQSTIFAQTIASLVNCTIEVVNTTGAYGAARAAGVGKGIYTNLEKAFQNVTPDRIYEPDIEISAYELAYSQWLTYLEKFN